MRDEKTRQEIGRGRGTDKQRDRHKQRYIEIKRQSVRANGPRGEVKGIESEWKEVGNTETHWETGKKKDEY